jgi:hypothetical protein
MRVVFGRRRGDAESICFKVGILRDMRQSRVCRPRAPLLGRHLESVTPLARKRA